MYRRALTTSLFAIAFLLTACAAKRLPESSAPPLTRDSVANATYHIDFPEHPDVKLVDGHYDNWDEHLNVTLVDSFGVFTDIDRDGDVDAVVLIATNFGGSGVFTDLTVVLNDSGVPAHMASYPLGDRTVPKTMTVSGNRITMDLIVHGPGEPRCCPTVPVTLSYVYRDGALILDADGDTRTRYPDIDIW